MFYTSLCFLALGSGGVRGSMTALGADQFDEKDPIEAKGLASYFNWLLLSTTLGAVIGVTGVVWVSTQRAWHWGFFIVTLASSIGFVTLALGKPFYRIRPPGESPISRIAQVFNLYLLSLVNKHTAHIISYNILCIISMKLFLLTTGYCCGFQKPKAITAGVQ